MLLALSFIPTFFSFFFFLVRFCFDAYLFFRAVAAVVSCVSWRIAPVWHNKAVQEQTTRQQPLLTATQQRTHHTHILIHILWLCVEFAAASTCYWLLCTTISGDTPTEKKKYIYCVCVCWEERKKRRRFFRHSATTTTTKKYDERN